MKEILAAFAAEIFRPIVTLLMPGFWALTPWVVSMFLHFPTTWKFANEYKHPFALIFVIVATGLGLLFEDLGAQIEAWIGDWKKHDKENWFSYLRMKNDAECIGTRYVRTLVLRMKFELGMTAASVFGFPGVICLPVSFRMKLIMLGGVVAIGGYLCFESFSSVSLLNDIRLKVFLQQKTESAK